MKIRITIRQVGTNKVLAEGVYEIAAEGDVGNVLPGLMAEARKVLGGPPAPLWGILISLDKAQ